MANDIEKTLARYMGPLLFRTVWWAHLDPARRKDFVDDFFKILTEALVQVFQAEKGKLTVSEQSREMAVAMLKQLVKDKVGNLDSIFPTFTNDTFDRVIKKVVEQKGQTKVNQILASQYRAFTSRIARLSESLISTVKIINEEFVIWLKMHPDHTEKIHADAFEQLSGEVLTSHGFAVQFTGRIKNLSADLMAIRKDENNEEIKYLIECKRYGAGQKVDLHIVNAVIGASYRAKVKHAMLLTTSSFTSNSSQILSDLEDIRLELHDGEQITEWLAGYNFKNMGLWLPEGWQDRWGSKK